MRYFATLQKALSGRLYIVAVVVTLAYLFTSVYAINRTIIISTISGSFSLDYKLTLLQSILFGSWSMYTPAEAILMAIIGILLGINIALMVKIFSSLKANKGLKVSFGGSSVLAVVSAGCPACGISLLSLVGISVPLLPFQGVPLQILSMCFLMGAILYSLRKLQQPMVCEVPSPSLKAKRGQIAKMPQGQLKHRLQG